MAASGGASDWGMGPLAESSALTNGMWWRRDFPGDANHLGEMRRWLQSLLPGCPARDDLVLVASEMGSNAILHTASGRGGRFTVEIIRQPLTMRVTVADGGAPDGPRVIDDPAGEHGRGMLVVLGLSVRSGVRGDDRGRLVWADVPWSAAGTAEPAVARDQHEVEIRDGEAVLARRFAGVPTWFGWSTLQWWALAGGELVAAASAEELASLLDRGLALRPPGHPLPRDTAAAGAGTVRAAVPDTWPGIPALRSCPGDGPLPGREQHSTGLRTPSAAQVRRRQGQAGISGLASAG
jgi:serine/threonine-protein kinase RsbW